MRTIYKFPLKRITDVQEVQVPGLVRWLDVQFQHGELCVWALVDPKGESAPHNIYIIGTGNPAAVTEFSEYIGTAQMAGGSLVWHVFASDPRS